MRKAAVLCCISMLFACTETIKKKDHQIIDVKKAEQPPTIDGQGNDRIWQKVDWHSIDQNWMGGSYSHEDFNGRYKLSWDAKALYLLVEITDDIRFDKTKDPLKLYWDDDCLEIFIDGDNSGGLHQYSHNAFAYHIALDGNVVDIAPDKSETLYNEHLVSALTTDKQLTTWEIALKVYSDTYVEGGQNLPEQLAKKKKMGFALAYCDNDGSTERENFIGSVFISGEDKNQAWINADIFGTLVLKE